MKAMILAAGRGERMRPLTDSTPKPLLELRGKPLIRYHVDALVAAGYTRLLINLSWHGELIRALLGDGEAFGATIEYSEEPEALETAGGIRQALDRLGPRFVVVNGDIHTDYDFSRLRAARDPAHLVLVPNPPHNLDGDFGLDGDRVVNRGMPTYTFSGIGVYAREFFAGLAPGKRPLAPLLRAAAERGAVGGEIYRGEWHDIGTPERLAALNA